MRKLDPAYAAHLKSGATTLCTCWRLGRSDGLVLGFTDHDRTLVFDGTTFSPANGLDGSETTARLGPQVDTSEVMGILTSAAISEDDLALGRYDGAMVETWSVNWRDPAMRHLRRRDTIGEITREDGIFRAELRSQGEALNRVGGRLYQHLCDAQLGDARCGVDLDAGAYKASAVVSAVLDRHRLGVSGLDAFDPGWFALGIGTWASGVRSGIADRIVTHRNDGGLVVLGFEEPVGDWVETGDNLGLVAGCDRRFSTCATRFGNAINFRGFPHIPGSDFVLKYPRSGDTLKGGALVR